MYKAKFVDNEGNTFLLDEANGIIFDIEGLSGISVDYAKAQGVQQIGETILTASVGSKTLTITGFIFENITEKKKRMRKVFAPFVSGKLIFNEKYYINVSVKDAPTFSPAVNNGKFYMQLLAPYPFFRFISETVSTLGKPVKSFSFPINYSETHIFATRSTERYINIINDGDMESDFTVYISSTSVSENPTLTNLKTFEFLKINRTISEGETIKIYRDNDGILNVVLIGEGGIEEDVFSDLDEGSNLFTLHRGDNVWGASAEADGDIIYNLNTTVTFNPVAVGVFNEA